MSLPEGIPPAVIVTAARGGLGHAGSSRAALEVYFPLDPSTIHHAPPPTGEVQFIYILLPLQARTTKHPLKRVSTPLHLLQTG